MGLFSFFQKNKPQPGSLQSAYQSRSEEDTSAVRAGRKRKTTGNQGNDAADPVLPEKKRARRRLVGAVALVLAAVIILPMVLDSQPKPLADDIAIQIPSRDKPASASASAAAAASGSSGDLSGLDKQEEIIDPASTPAPSATPKAELAKPAPAGTAPAPSLAGTANVAQAPAAEPEVKPEPKPAAKPKPENKPKVELKQERKPKSEPPSPAEKPDLGEPRGDAARAAAILNGHSDAAQSAEKKNGKFVVQVAALASQEKVDELRGTLSDAGIHSYTQKIKTSAGERIRIRLGPFASKEEAEKARARLAPLGLSGSLVPA